MLRLLAVLCGLVTCLATASVAEAHKKRGHHHHAGKAQHSLRAPVTRDNFYFVMADRFQNGTAANDDGGRRPRRARTGAARPASTTRAPAGTTAAT